MNTTYIGILLLLFIDCAPANNKRIRTITDNLRTHLDTGLRASINSSAVRACPNYDAERKFIYYQKEQSFFQLDRALLEVKRWTKSHELNDEDSVIIVLFYLAVGFDPQAGYETNYYIYQTDSNNARVGKFNEQTLQFDTYETSLGAAKTEIQRYDQFRNGCESGHLAVIHLAPDLSVRDIRTVVGLEFDL